MSLDPKNPRPGVYPGVDERTYREIDAINVHGLFEIQNGSPSHFKYKLDHPEPATSAMVMGSAVHCRLLQPEIFEKLFVIAPGCSEITGKGSRCSRDGKAICQGKWYCTQHMPGEADVIDQTPLSKSEHDNCLAICDGNSRRRILTEIIESIDQPNRELTLIWIDENTGVTCKGRIDMLSKGGAIFDLKTCESANPMKFARDALEYSYHQQAAFYLDGCAALGVHADIFYFMALEKTPPYEPAGLYFPDKFIDFGRRANRCLLQTYAWCKKTGIWPGFGAVPFEIELPNYFYERLTKMETLHLENYRGVESEDHKQLEVSDVGN